MFQVSPLLFFFFFNDTATTEIYTLSLHDALPILRACRVPSRGDSGGRGGSRRLRLRPRTRTTDRKSTRLNSSHGYISYAVFCLKKKKKKERCKRRKTDAHDTACGRSGHRVHTHVS